MSDQLQEEQVAEKVVEQFYEGGRVFVREMKSGNYNLLEELSRQRSGPRVFKGGEVGWHGGPQTWHKNLLNPGMGLMQTLTASFELLAPGGRSQMHGHQNPALLYVIEGHGYDISDGQRADWQEGDSALVAPGSVHQHFNADSKNPARVLIIKGKPIYMFAHLIFQGFVEKAPKTAMPGFESFRPPEL